MPGKIKILSEICSSKEFENSEPAVMQLPGRLPVSYQLPALFIPQTQPQ
jgi:hypothetical protein